MEDEMQRMQDEIYPEDKEFLEFRIHRIGLIPYDDDTMGES
jgi:hypothetical protein